MGNSGVVLRLSCVAALSLALPCVAMAAGTTKAAPDVSIPRSVSSYKALGHYWELPLKARLLCADENMQVAMPDPSWTWANDPNFMEGHKPHGRLVWARRSGRFIVLQCEHDGDRPRFESFAVEVEPPHGQRFFVIASAHGKVEPERAIVELRRAVGKGPRFPTDASAYRMLKSKSALPPAVARQCTNGFSTLADIGGRWEPGDVITDEAIPRHRLVWAAASGTHFLLECEHGGDGRYFDIQEVDADPAGSQFRYVAWTWARPDTSVAQAIDALRPELRETRDDGR